MMEQLAIRKTKTQNSIASWDKVYGKAGVRSKNLK